MKNILVIFDCFGVLCDKVFSTLIPTYVSEEKCREIDENIVGPAEVGEMTREHMRDMQREYSKCLILNIFLTAFSFRTNVSL